MTASIRYLVGSHTRQGANIKNPFQLSAHQAHFKPELRRAMVEELYQRFPFTLVGLLITLAVMYFALADVIHHYPMVGRIMQGMFVVVLLRGLAVHLVRRSPEWRLRVWIYLAGSTATALCIAILNIYAYPLLQPPDVALLALLDAGICSAALMSMGSSFLAYSLYLIPILGSLDLMIGIGPHTRWVDALLILTTIYLVALFVFALQQAISHQREVILRMEMAEMALRDNLTQLRNRRALMEFMSLETAQVLRSWQVGAPAGAKAPLSLGILVIDMDHFKEVNDTYGHGAGDAVLVQLAAILVDAVRKPDIVVRWGGEEFVIGARDTDRVPPSRLAERIRSRVENHPFVLPSGETIRRTCSIGYSVFPFTGDIPDLLDWEQVISVADAGMYAAKTHGRNQSIGVMAGAAITPDSEVIGRLSLGLDQAQQHGLVHIVGRAR